MMNLEQVIKEYEQLQTSVVKTDNVERKVFPHIVSKDSFERMIMTAEDYANTSTRNESQTPPPLSNSPAAMKMIKVNAPKIQQTSVITANNAVHKPSAATRKLSMQRQARFDDSVEPTDPECPTEKSYVMTDKDSDTPTVIYKNYNLTPQTTFDNYTSHAPTHYEKPTRFDKYRSLSAEGQSDSYGNVMFDAGEQHNSKLPVKGSYSPMRMYKQSTASFESDEQAAHYMNALHISPTQHYYTDPYGSLHSSSRESLIDSPTNSIRNSSSRRLHDSQYDVMHDSTSPIPAAPTVRSPNFRTYESQHHRQYKYCQRRAISLNTAPYHSVNSEQNIRRILSEEIVAENPLIDSMRRAGSMNSKLRRAASYDTFDDFGRELPSHSPLDKERQFASLGQHPASPSQPPTKIIFPEHANVKDHTNIFTQQHINQSECVNSDESAHFMNRQPYASPEHPDIQPNFKHTATLIQHFNKNNNNNNNNNNNTVNNTEKENKNENQAAPKTKGSSKSQCDNYTIGPYEYDPEKDDEIAVCVSGLLMLPGSNEKRYPISVGELRRRIAPPEYLNKVDMISYVRLAKTSARELLEKYEIRPKHHSRKSKHSVISKMCEAECAELANGINVLSDAYFPEEWLARLSLSSKEEGDSDEVTQRLSEEKTKVEIATSVLQEFLVLLENNKSAKEMQDYNLATHSYGLLDITNNIKLVTRYLDSQKRLITSSVGNTTTNERINNNNNPHGSNSSSNNDNSSSSIHAMDTDMEGLTLKVEKNS